MHLIIVRTYVLSTQLGVLHVLSVRKCADFHENRLIYLYLSTRELFALTHTTYKPCQCKPYLYVCYKMCDYDHVNRVGQGCLHTDSEYHIIYLFTHYTCTRTYTISYTTH